MTESEWIVLAQWKLEGGAVGDQCNLGGMMVQVPRHPNDLRFQVLCYPRNVCNQWHICINLMLMCNESLPAFD